MKRLAKFQNPRMISARVEKTDAEKFELILAQQQYLTLQDYVGFALTMFISGTVYVDGKDFVVKHG